MTVLPSALVAVKCDPRLFCLSESSVSSVPCQMTLVTWLLVDCCAIYRVKLHISDTSNPIEGCDMDESIEAFLQKLPTPDDVRRELSRNIREQRLLKQVLKLVEQRARVQEVATNAKA